MTAIGTNEASRNTVYAAIELSKKNWVVGIATPERDRPSIHRMAGGNLNELVARVRAAAKGGRRILICYEAGYDGFWIARSLARENIECRVLDPASIQVNRRARRVKTDRIDVLMLLRALIAIDRGERHVCAVVRVPSTEEEDARRPHRERQRLVRERTGHINRIKGLLFAQGIRGDAADAQEPAVERKRQMLIALQGIGGAGAAILAREVFARTFSNRRQLGSYLGLTPSAYDSGSTTRCQGISKAGNSWARRLLIEVAWLWRKYQPDSPLSRWYAAKTREQSPRIRRTMLIALARKLAVTLWRYVETGVVPEGAIMSNAA